MVKNKLGIKSHSEPIYEEKYLNAKVREFDGVIKTNFLGNDTPKENMHYTCIACTTIGSELEPHSEADSISGTELMAKLNSDSDSE